MRDLGFIAVNSGLVNSGFRDIDLYKIKVPKTKEQGLQSTSPQSRAQVHSPAFEMKHAVRALDLLVAQRPGILGSLTLEGVEGLRGAPT